MTETVFLLSGQHVRSHDGYTRNDCLAYLYPTVEEAVAACRKSYPDFVINEITIDDTKPEVVKVQSLI